MVPLVAMVLAGLVGGLSTAAAVSSEFVTCVACSDVSIIGDR